MSKDMSNDKEKKIDNSEIINDESIDNLNKNEEKKTSKFKSYISGSKGKIIITAILALALGMGTGVYVGTEVGRSLPATHKHYSKSQVLATVGDTKITGEDLAKRMDPYFYYHGLSKLSDEEVETQETNTLNYMTNLEALYLAAVDNGVKVSDKEVDENYSTTMSYIESYFNLTQDEFFDKFNLTEDFVKESLKKELIATKYLQENSEVDEKEAKNYYNNHKGDFFEVKASHILISNYDDDGNEVSKEKKKENKELAEKILKRAQKGESFEDLALEYSDDTYTASNGGDLGYFSKGEMDKDFEAAVFSLKDGEIYPKVVETSYGYHIIKKTGEQYSPFDDVKDTLMETLTSDKQSILLQDALEKYNVKLNI